MENPQSGQKPTLHELLTDAVDLTNNQIDYVNVVTVNAAQYEVFVDLFRLSPKADRSLQAHHVYKFVMPMSVAAEFRNVLEKVLGERDTDEANDEKSEQG
jgi:hypothetical protein